MSSPGLILKREQRLFLSALSSDGLRPPFFRTPSNVIKLNEMAPPHRRDFILSTCSTLDVLSVSHCGAQRWSASHQGRVCLRVFHERTLQDTYASLNSVEIPHLLHSTPNIMRALFSPSVQAQPGVGMIFSSSVPPTTSFSQHHPNPPPPSVSNCFHR